MTPWGRARTSLCALVFFALCLGGAPHAARAQLDMTGPWDAQALIAFGPTVHCTFDLVQTGSNLAIAGECDLVGSITATATIDVMTGDFSGSGSAGPVCPTMTLTLGSAELDGTSFFVSFNCSGGPLPVVGGIYGYRCGNGVIDSAIGETCDDGDRLGFDCCTDTCVFKGAGLVCPGDENQCTDDVCDGAGTCTHPNRTGSCDDDNSCSTGDTCVDGACTATSVPDDTACDDFNDCTAESCQGGVCAATDKPDGTACEDGYLCTAGETCVSGTCEIGPPRVCPPCRRCYESNGCEPVPFDGMPCDYYDHARVLIKKTGTDSVKWTWTGLNALAVDDFGDPTASTAYEFCVFDSFAADPETGVSGRILFSAAVPAGTSWKSKRNGYAFKSADKLKLRLKAGSAGKSKLLVRAKGPTHVVNYLPPLDELHVVLRTAEGVTPQRCFQAYFSPPITSTSTVYKGEDPTP
jgi:hypothetical protein